MAGKTTRRFDDDSYREFYRCDACGSVNKFGRSPQGGRHNPPSEVRSVDAVTGKTFYVDNAAGQGCWFCGSPAWARGGRLGDLANPF